MEIKFTVLGNAGDQIGTQGEVGANKDYYEYVRECFYGQVKIKDIPMVIDDNLAEAIINNKSYPLRVADGYLNPIGVSKFEVSIHIKIYWAENPGMPHQVFYGILLALVTHLKTLKAAGFTSEMSKDKKGRVEVAIGIK